LKRDDDPTMNHSNHTTTNTNTNTTTATNTSNEDRALDTQLYCLCRAPDDGTFMLACDRCSEWCDAAHRAKSANFHRFPLAGSTAVACM